MAYSDVQVTFEIGHRSSLRSKLTQEGFTHDWEIFVRGLEGTDISHFVEKVVFYLHETFPKPKRVIKEPPYSVKESGYAGFNLIIDIYFKNKDEPKKFKYYYDLELQTSGPPINKVLREKYTFPSPSGDFRKKLIKGGGIGVNGVDGQVVDKPLLTEVSSGSSQSSKSATSSQGKSKPVPDTAKKHKIKEPKTEEFRPTSQFSELFGPPIKTTKVSPDPKKQSPSSSKTLPNVKPSKPAEKPSSSDKPSSESKSKHSSQKDTKRDKEGTSREDKKEKRDKSKDSEKKAVKPTSPSPKPIKEELKRPEEPNKETNDDVKTEKKKKEKKSREEKEKSKKDKHKDHDKPTDKTAEKSKDKDNKKSPKSIPPSREPEKTEKVKDKEKHRDGEKDRQKHKHKKKEKEKNKKSKEDGKERSKGKKEKQESKDRVKNGMEENSTVFKAPEPHSPSPPVYTPPSKPPPEKISPATQSKEKTTKNPLSTLFEELSDHETSDSNNSPMSADEDLLEFPPSKPKEIKKEESKKVSKEKEASIDKGGSSKSKQKEAEKRPEKGESTKEQKRRKRKGSHSRDGEDGEAMNKSLKQDFTDIEQNDIEPLIEPLEPARPSPTSNSDQYVCELKELQHKIMNLDDDEVMQRLVSVIEETGQYEITKKTFDFDLRSLDRSTVKRLQDFFRNL